MTDIYVSTDIEADGPIPGPYSMLSFASAVYRPDKTLLDTFSANLEPLPGAATDPDTMEWWEKHPKAWRANRENLQTPEVAMKNYVAWLDSLPGEPVFVAYPATYDFMFVYWYLMKFVGYSPFAHHGLDISSYAMAVLKINFLDCRRDTMPAAWFDDLPHTHRPLDDAIEQGAWFINMLQDNLKR